MRYLTCLLLLVLLMTGSCSLFQKSEDQLFNNGITMLKNGDSYGAIEQFDKIDTLYPGSPWGYYGRGIAFEKDFRRFDAINAYLRVIQNDPEFIPGYKALVKIASETDHPRLAVDIAFQYNEKEKDSTALLQSRAEMLLGVGEYDLAEKEMAKIAEKSTSDPNIQLFYAQINLHRGNIDAALKNCATAFQSDTGNADLSIKIGNIFRQIGRSDSASAYYSAALASPNIDYFQKAGIADDLIDMNYLEDANKLISDLEDESTSNHAVKYLNTRLLEAEGRQFEAKEYYPKQVYKSKMTPAVLMHMADFKLRAADEAGGILSLEDAAAAADADSFHVGLYDELLLKKPLIFLEKGDWRSADGILRPLLNVMPLDFKVVYLQSLIYLLSDNNKAAKESLDRLEILVEENPYRLDKFAKLYFIADSLNKSDSLYSLALEKDKLNIPAILGKIEIYIAKKQFKNAIKYLEGFEDYILFDYQVYPELINLYRQNGDLKKARDFTNRLLEVAPADINRYRLAIDLAREDKQPGVAGEIVQKCLDNNPDNYYARILAANYYFDQGDETKVRDLLNPIIAESRQSPEAYYLIGRLCEIDNQIDSAVSYYNQALEFDSYDGRPYGRLAVIMLEKEDLDKKAISEIANYIRLAQRSEDKPEYYLIMGRLQEAQGRFTAAGKNFARALEDDKNNPEYNYYAGMNYLKLDSAGKAKTLLNRAIKNGLKDDLKKIAETTLGRL